MKEHPELNLAFSISCTSRAPRGTEQNGVEYFFLTPEEFRQRIDNEEFLEYEEVYEGRFYGTLKAQVERQLEAGQNGLPPFPPARTRRRVPRAGRTHLQVPSMTILSGSPPAQTPASQAIPRCIVL